MKDVENGFKIAIPTDDKEEEILVEYKYTSIDDSGNVIANPVMLLAILQRMDEKKIIEVELNLYYKELQVGYADDYESMTHAWIPSNREIIQSYYSLKGLKRALKEVVIPKNINLTVRTNEDGMILNTQGKSECDTLNICRLIGDFC